MLRFNEDKSVPAPVEQTELPPALFVDQELNFENVESFVRQRGRASCKDLMVAFRLTYSQAVFFMDALEERGVIPPIQLRADGGVVSAGPRTILPIAL